MKGMNATTNGKALFNEYVAARFANLIGLPTPNFELGILDNSKIQKNSILKDNEFKSGNCFLSQYVRGTALKINEKSVKMIQNVQDIPKLVLFDALLLNTDRGPNMGNWFFTSDRKIIAIDHTNIFRVAQIWDKNSLEQDMQIPPLVDESLNDEAYIIIMNRYIQEKSDVHHPFEPSVRKISSLTKKQLEGCFKDIPEEWDISNEDRFAAEEFLKFQVKHIRDLSKALEIKFHLRKKK